MKDRNKSKMTKSFVVSRSKGMVMPLTQTRKWGVGVCFLVAHKETD